MSRVARRACLSWSFGLSAALWALIALVLR